MSAHLGAVLTLTEARGDQRVVFCYLCHKHLLVNREAALCIHTAHCKTRSEEQEPLPLPDCRSFIHSSCPSVSVEVLIVNSSFNNAGCDFGGEKFRMGGCYLSG